MACVGKGWISVLMSDGSWLVLTSQMSNEWKLLSSFGEQSSTLAVSGLCSVVILAPSPNTSEWRCRRMRYK